MCLALLTGCGGGGGGSNPSPPPPPSADTTPNTFSFTAQTGIALSAVVASGEVTIDGINAASTVTITGGEYSINGGAYTSAAGTVTTGQRIQVRVTGSAQFSTAATATLTVGGVSAAFTATTLAADPVPDAFQIARKVDVVRDAWVESDSIPIAGINTSSPVTIVNGEYSISGGAFTSAAGSIIPGQSFVVRARAAAGYSRNTRASITIGTVSANFDVTSELPNYQPDGIAYDGQDVVYLLSGANQMLFRWSISEAHYLDPYTVGFGGAAPTSMTYVSAHQRVYLGYASGLIRQINVSATAPAEASFASMSGNVSSLGSAGNFLVAQMNSGYNGGYLLNGSGVVTGQGGYYYGYSRETAWDPVTSRVYYFRDGISPNDLQFDVIDQATGTVSSAGEAPYHGAYNILGPIRVSVDGQNVLLGSGDIYAQSTLNWAGSLGTQVRDARWFTNGSLVTLTTSGSQTTLRRLGASTLPVLEQLNYAGQALRVVGSDTRMAVVLSNNNTVRIHTYIPSDDSDGDGVTNTQDAFPLDRAASADADQDGYPDSWNTGRTAADSTTGLTLDAFPQDSACWLATHANTAGTCDYGATMPSYMPDQIVQGGDVVYLLSSVNNRVYRWSISTGAYLNPYVVGINQGFTTLAPSKIAYASNNQRLYLGYSTGAIRYINTAGTSPAEVAFANTALGVNGLASVGNYVLAEDASGAWATHYIFNASGAVTDSADWNYYSREYAWDPVNSRVYFFRDDSSPNDLHYEVINQSTGEITSEGETPYHGDYNIIPPIRVSVNGQYVLLGSGDIYAQSTLNWSGSLGGQVADARWLANGSIVTLATANNQTTLRRLSSSNLTNLEQVSFAGQALRVVGSDTQMAVIVVNNGTVQFYSYVPNDDSDGDGVLNTVDAFPLDRAASVDTDGDGYPDSWNAGRTQADSTTGLTLDAFPQDSACYLASHGSGGVCNYGATIPNYTPDAVAQQGDVIYLLSATHRRVYRWSISGGAYLNPYVVGINQGFTTVAPTAMAYSAAHNRLYLGYETGAIRYIDVNAGPLETAFTNLPARISSLGSAGNYLLAQSDTGYDGGYILNSSGAITDRGGYYYGYSRETAWDPVTSRAYYVRDGLSPNDLHYDRIDQATGTVLSQGETPYHGDYGIGGVIRPTNDGQFVLLGTGDIYAQSTLNWSGSLGSAVTDARWLANGSLITLTTANNQTLLRRLSGTSLSTVEQLTYSGEALRVVGSDTAMVVIARDNGAVRFYNYVPNDDSDNDGVDNTQDAFPLDRAASVDTDRDGFPDAWNAGRTQADSTTGLTLDAFPNDTACWLAAHGSGGVCNYGATIPNYTPDKVVQQGDVIYLLSAANRRVYRWSISGGAYLNPYVVGLNQGFTTLAPRTIEYSAAHQRLYVGYPSGAIRYIDVNAASPAEVTFASPSDEVSNLTSAGNFLVVQTGGYYSYTGSFVLNSVGATVDQGDSYYYSDSTAWDPVTSRLYYVGSGSTAIYYEVINQTTGLITSSGNSPYNSNAYAQPPVRVSANGQTILLGSGELYAQSTLTWAGSLGTTVVDARWLANGTLTTLTTANNQTLMRRLGGANLSVLEQVAYTGQGLRVVGSDTAMVVIAINNGTVQFYNYVPNDDSDGDGVTNTLDAFPLDPAASVDTDADGYPNAWNAGRTQADSTSVPQLTLDAFPNDAACWLTAHGSGGLCNYGATIPSYVPDAIAQDGDIIYLLSSANRRVYRRSISTGAYLNPYVVGVTQGFSAVAPTRMALSPAQHRLYLGYDSGAIRYIDTSAGPSEVAFLTLAASVSSLSSAGNYLLAQSNGGQIINSSGVVTGQGGNYYGYSRETAWDPVNSRVYYFRDGTSPNDLHYDQISQATGTVSSSGETPYHGDYPVGGVIRVSNDGQSVLLGTGDIYAQSTLNWTASVGGQIADARWFANGSVATLSTSGNQTVLRRLGSSNLALQEQVAYTGQALRIVGSDTAMVVIVNNGGNVAFHNYVPNNDTDNDGVTNAQDAFPLDRAASVDTDRDGYPDSWNAGMTQADSTSVPQLALDAFPTESACWLASHGSGGVCNYAATLPNYTPDKIDQNGDIVYLLSSANRRVYRWSIATGSYLSPYVVGMDLGFNTLAPTTIAFSSAHNRLYLGYSNGAIRYIDVTAGAAEVSFTTLPAAVSMLSSAGNFLATQVNGGYNSGYVLNSSGVTTTHGGYYYGYSRETAWDPVSSRLYYTRDGLSPNDLHYDEIDQATGLIAATGETPYHGEYGFSGPIRVSPDGSRILLGTGDIYQRSGLTRMGTLGKAIADAKWKDNLVIDVDTTDLVEIRDANSRAVLQSYQYLGQPLRVLFGTSEGYLVHVMNGTTSFVRLPFYDQDGDLMARWWEQVYGLSDSNPADATTDLDSDGVNNQAEFLNLSNPTLADTDSDQLTDSQEIVTWHTNPAKADTDGDGLGDYAEVITHHSDPLDTDSDNDTYTDLIEVLYGGNPNDSSALPQPLTTYNQTFEGTPNLAAWTSTAQSSAPWAVDTLMPRSGSASFKSGSVANARSSAVQFRGFFRPGQLTFWTRMDNGSCCNRMYVLVDGVQQLYLSGNGQWNSHTITLTLGIHDIEWRFDRESNGGQASDSARIDDVVFTGQ